MGEVGARERVLFGRVTHSGRADYLVQQWVEDDARIHLHWWRNDGSGGTQLKAVSHRRELAMYALATNE
jgi:hypothetical protein